MRIVKRGSNSSRKENPSIIADFVGTQRKPNAKTTVNSAAVAICGIEVVNTAMTEITRSNIDPSFMPAKTPSVKDTGIMIRKT